MTRLLAIAFLVVIVVSLIVSRLRPLFAVAREIKDALRRPAAPSAPRAAAPGERLVACTVCGTRVPASRVLASGGVESFCSDECRRKSRGSERRVETG